MICPLALTCETFTGSPGKPQINLPRLDINYLTREPIFHLLRGYENLSLIDRPLSAPSCSCRFINEGMSFIRWDGQVAPCLALLHDHTTYLYGLERRIRAYLPGDLNSRSLADIWSSQDYHDFREKVYLFDYSPCHICGGCSVRKMRKTVRVILFPSVAAVSGLRVLFSAPDHGFRAHNV